MHARDSSGRNVSLLNDEPAAQDSISFQNFSFGAQDHSSMERSHSNLSAHSRNSSPHVPELVRTDSFDSSNTHDQRSPVTPVSMREFGQQNPYAAYKTQAHFEYREPPRMDEFLSHQYTMPPTNSYPSQQPYPEPQLYAEESYLRRNNAPPERGPKRYPCRHRDTHGCDKTFTTSGHASRHSKIHTAEKGVVCTWKGCQKKFTRGDNMKQHLETHTKERSRSSTSSQKAVTIRTLTMPGGVRKSNTIESPSPRPESRNKFGPPAEPCLVDPALLDHQSMFSSYEPASTSSYMQPTLSPRSESGNSGLDFLANAALYSN